MRGVFFTDAGKILQKEDVFLAMQVIFDAPVSAIQGQDIPRGSVQTGDKIRCFYGGFFRFCHGADPGNDTHMAQTRPGFGQGVGRRNHLNCAFFDASVALVDRGMALMGGGPR